MHVIGRLLWAGMAPIALAIWDEKVAKATPLSTQRPPPPERISPPPGWRYAGQKDVTSEMSAFAVQVLHAGYLPGHVQMATTSDGRQYGAMTDWHYDNHVSAEEKWHIGISLVVPKQASIGFDRMAA